jgi:hypothetical protein
MDPEIWQNTPRVSASDNDLLCKPFSEQEVKNALDQMGKKTRPRGLIKFLLSSIKVIGK